MWVCVCFIFLPHVMCACHVCGMSSLGVFFSIFCKNSFMMLPRDLRTVNHRLRCNNNPEAERLRLSAATLDLLRLLMHQVKTGQRNKRCPVGGHLFSRAPLITARVGQSWFSVFKGSFFHTVSGRMPVWSRSGPTGAWRTSTDKGQRPRGRQAGLKMT